MKRTILVTIFFCCWIQLFPQVSIDSSYIDYFEDTREIPFLHLNKTTFIEGEEIWFQAYVLEPNTNKLHSRTSNLYVSIYNEDGELEKQQLIKIEDGIGNGNIPIDSTFTNQNYFIKASTNWMLNKNVNQSFIQQIKIIGNHNTRDNEYIEDDFDFQLFPEGGHLLEGTNNTIGVLIKDSKGIGQKIKSGILKDKSGNIVSSFTTNFLGLGSFNVLYKEDERYTVDVVLENSKIITKEVPIAVKQGVIIKVDNQNPAYTSISLNSNEASLKELSGEKYQILVHNTISIYKQDFTFNEDNDINILVLQKSKIPQGANIITVLNEKGTPILERIIFNYKKDLFTSLNLKSKRKGNDSISIDFSTLNQEKMKFSTSFLPDETIAYNPSNNIYTSFLLRPFIKGDIQNPEYYFKNVSRKKLKELDILLLTQGWSKYPWENIFNTKVKAAFEFEQGIAIKGEIVNDKIKDSTNIFLISKENNTIRSTFIVNNAFEFNNLTLLDSSSVKLTIPLKNRLKKPKIAIKFFPSEELDSKNLNTLSVINQERRQTDFSDFILEGLEILDTVVLQAQVKIKNKPRIIGVYNSYKTKDLPYKSQRLVDFIQMKGFRVVENNFNVEITEKIMESLLTTRFKPANVFLDKVQIQSNYFNNLQIIHHTFIQDYEEIFLSTSISNTIHLYSNRDFGSAKSKFVNDEVPFGYARKKEYYQPKYASRHSGNFDAYGAVYWKSNHSGDQSTTTINIPHFNQERIRIFIEGITTEGKLISEEKVIKIH